MTNRIDENTATFSRLTTAQLDERYLSNEAIPEWYVPQYGRINTVKIYNSDLDSVENYGAERLLNHADRYLRIFQLVNRGALMGVATEYADKYANL